MGIPVRILYAAADTVEAPFDRRQLADSDQVSVIAVSDTDEGLERLTTDDFDCILSAYDLPCQTGIEFLTAVRERYPTLPFILFGTDGRETVTTEARAAGVTDVLDSPAKSNGDMLIGRIQAVARQYRMDNERPTQPDLFEQAHTIAEIGVWEYHMGTTRSFVSETALQIYGLSPGDTLSLDESFQYYHTADRDAVREAFQHAREEGHPFTLETRVVRDDDTQRWVRVRGEPVCSDGTTRSIRGIIQDISDEKRLQNELQQQNDTLNDLIQVVSHDIRNPLQVGFGQLDHARETGSEEAFDRIRDALERIQELMDNIVTLSQQGQEPRRIERIDLAEIAQTALEAVNESRITLTTVGKCRVDADPVRIQKLFQRLFENTAEHTDASVTVTVGLIQPVFTTTRDTSAQSAGFYVEDDGPALDDSLLEHIFEGGFSITADETGFRLASAAQIADAHGWDMTVSSTTACGTRFEFVDRSILDS